MKTALVYSRDNCVFCTKAKALLEKNNIPYKELLIDTQGRDNRMLTENQSWTTKDDLLKARPGVKTVPQIWIDNEYVGGYTELEAKLNL
jgi:glutaredoxin